MNKNIKLIENDLKAEDIELFKVLLDTEGSIKIKVNPEFISKSSEDIALLLKDDIKNLEPIITKVIQLM